MTGLYIGVNGVPKKIKKMYVGVNGISKKIKKGYIGINGIPKLFYQDSILPEDYQQVEYIRNSGYTQYINPGNIYPDSDTTVYIKYVAKARKSSSSGGKLFGYDVRGYSNSYPYKSGSYLNYYYYLETDNYNYNRFGRYIYPSGDSSQYSYINFSSGIGTLNKMNEILYNEPGGNFYENGTKKQTVTVTFSNENMWNWNQTASWKPRLIILGMMEIESGNGSAIITPADVEYELYQCSVWQSGNQIRDMYPCYRKSDNVIGMYDIVGKTFYTNAGSGTFYKGPNKS